MCISLPCNNFSVGFLCPLFVSLNLLVKTIMKPLVVLGHSPGTVLLNSAIGGQLFEVNEPFNFGLNGFFVWCSLWDQVNDLPSYAPDRIVWRLIRLTPYVYFCSDGGAIRIFNGL